VKRLVGAVRFLFEDLLQGVLQLLFLVSRWDHVSLFDRCQVGGSVAAGLTVSFLGPLLEHRKHAASSRQLLELQKWEEAGGAVVPKLQEILVAEGQKYVEVDGLRVFGDGVGQLTFDKPLRSQVGGSAQISYNGTVAKPGVELRGTVSFAPQKCFATCITQYILGFADEAGNPSQLQPLFDGQPGHNPRTITQQFVIAAPKQPGEYPVAFHFDMMYTMEDAMDNFRNRKVDPTRVVGYIIVRD